MVFWTLDVGGESFWEVEMELLQKPENFRLEGTEINTTMRRVRIDGRI